MIKAINWHAFWQILRDNRRWLIMVFLCFISGVILGTATGLCKTDFTKKYVDYLEKFFMPFHNILRKKNLWLLFFVIFLNNMRAITIMMFIGWFFFPLTVLAVGLNGFNLGILAVAFLRKGGQSFLPNFFLAVAPHGIVELLAMFLGAAIAIKFGYYMYARYFNIKYHDFYTACKKELQESVPYLIILLAAAAFIESFITPEILGM